MQRPTQEKKRQPRPGRDQRGQADLFEHKPSDIGTPIAGHQAQLPFEVPSSDWSQPASQQAYRAGEVLGERTQKHVQGRPGHQGFGLWSEATCPSTGVQIEGRQSVRQ